jgi:hypothetical protein
MNLKTNLKDLSLSLLLSSSSSGDVVVTTGVASASLLEAGLLSRVAAASVASAGLISRVASASALHAGGSWAATGSGCGTKETKKEGTTSGRYRQRDTYGGYALSYNVFGGGRGSITFALLRTAPTHITRKLCA